MSNFEDAKLAAGTEWRREVSARLHDYRVRRGGVASRDVQADLPFEAEATGTYDAVGARGSFAAATAPAPASAPVRRANGARAHQPERFEISIPMLGSAGASQAEWEGSPQAGATGAHAKLFDIAPLSERRRAAFVDAALLVFSYGGMLALFTVLGGRIGFNKVDLTVAGFTFALFYAQYFALFTVFGGSTPGMMLRGMRVASFAGGTPTSRQMAWRSFGYLISAGTCFLGFIWALWDDDQLCWQDRISETYLTSAEQLSNRSPEISRAR